MFLATTVVLCIASYIGLVIVERQATDAVLRAESLRATSAAHAFADAYVQERLRREVDDAVIAVREMHRAASKESLPLGKLQLRIAKELEKRGIGESGGVYVIGPDLRFVVEPPSEGAVPRQVRNRDVRLRLRHLREGYREHTDTLAPGGVSPVLATYSRYFQEWDWVITAAAYKRNLVRDVPSEDLKPMSMASASQGSMEVFFTNSQGRTITQPYYSDHDLARLGEVISNLPPASVRLPGDDALTRWKGPGGSVYVLSPVAHTDWVSVVTAPSRWRPPAVIRMSHAFVVHLLWFSVIVMLAGGWGMVWITSVARHLRAGASEMVEEQVALRTLDLQSDRDQLDVQLSEKDEEMRRMIRKNGELVTRLEDLRQTSYEVNLLNQTGDLLQACQTMEETDSIVAEMVRELFPRAAGMLCRQSETQSFLEVVASWRDPLLGQTEIAVEDCWALRRGREYAIDSADAELICPHVPESPPHGYICLPMIAQGELLGLLHLQWAGPDSGVGEEQWQRHLASRKRLALRVTEQFSLALANLKLREMLRGQSIRDQLTGLYNRRHMEESLTPRNPPRQPPRPAHGHHHARCGPLQAVQ